MICNTGADRFLEITLEYADKSIGRFQLLPGHKKLVARTGDFVGYFGSWRRDRALWKVGPRPMGVLSYAPDPKAKGISLAGFPGLGNR